nr:hypothetical protein [uncultured Arsenicibacter sp.]
MSLASLIETRGVSPISEVLQNSIPRTVEAVGQALPETPILPIAKWLGGSRAPDPAPIQREAPEDDDEPDDEPLTAEEIRTKAESKAEMWGAVIALLFSFVNRYMAYQQLREGDKELIKEFELHVKATGNVPVYEPTHPYHDARQRWDAFEESLDDAEQEAQLNDAQMLLLRRSIESDLKAKNRRGKLKAGSIAEVLFEIAVIKAMAPMLQFSMLTVNRMVDKRMK